MVPAFTAIFSAKQTALLIGTKNMAKRCNYCNIFILRIDPQITNVACVVKPDMHPVLTTIGRAINTITINNIPALLDLAGACPDHIRVTG